MAPRFANVAASVLTKGEHVFKIEVYRNGPRGIEWYPHSTGYRGLEEARATALSVKGQGIAKVRVLDLGKCGKRYYARDVVFEFDTGAEFTHDEPCAVGKKKLPERP